MLELILIKFNLILSDRAIPFGGQAALEWQLPTIVRAHSCAPLPTTDRHQHITMIKRCK